MVHNSSLANEELQYFSDHGGYALGMKLAGKYAEECGFVTPEQHVIPLDYAGTVRDLQVFADVFPNGFGAKKSGLRESFTEYALRGVNTSSGFYWSPTSPLSCGEVIYEALEAARAERDTTKSQTIVIQEYIAGWRLAANILEQGVLCELIDTGGRTLINHTTNPKSKHIENFESKGDRSNYDVDKLLSVLLALRKRLPFDANVECMVTDEPYITQLRPIPPEDCLVHIEHSSRTMPASMQAAHYTACVNGIWQSDTAFTVGNYSDIGPNVAFKNHKDIRQCTDIMESLAAQIPTLVLDPYTGFKVTHEPENLPRNPTLRRFFGYISVANAAVIPEPGQSVIVNINQQEGVIYA